MIWIGPSGTTLTYGRERITADARISVEQPYLRDWNLYIRHAKPRDAGTYTCKVTTNPPQTKKVHLIIRGIFFFIFKINHNVLGFFAGNVWHLNVFFHLYEFEHH